MAAKKENDAPTTVLVGVGAGIAAYKVAHVVRAFKARGFEVHVLPTEASLNFVGATTWVELSENPVATSVFSTQGPGHVRLASAADLIVLAPATADLLAKVAGGFASDLLTATVLASEAPVIAFPAMHTQMWRSPATQDNIATLRRHGATVIDPDDGPLSSGDTGPGRLPEPERIVAESLDLLFADGPLKGRRVLITAGGSQEPIDPVRFVGNRSSGTQGFALAQAALEKGAEVALITSATTAEPPSTSRRLRVRSAPSAQSLHDGVFAELADTDVLIMAAAVADFTPQTPAQTKIKKTPETNDLMLHLTRTQDVLRAVVQSADRPPVVIGFGAETGSPQQVQLLGAQKAQSKGADLLAVNQVGEGRGFGDVPNRLYYFDSEGQPVGTVEGSKREVADDLIARALGLLTSKDAS